MKLAVLKILSLLVFLGGVLLLGLILEDGKEAGLFTARYSSFLDAVATGGEEAAEGGRGSLRAFGVVSGLAMLLVGLYGFVPKLRARKDSFTYQSSAGEVTIQLDAVERSLQRVLAKMAEIKKVRVQLAPAGSGKQVQVRAWATLVKPEGLSARATTERVHRFIERTAKEHLGLEELAPIALCVDFAVNAKVSERAMRSEVQREESGAAAPRAVTAAAAAVYPEHATKESENAQAVGGDDAPEAELYQVEDYDLEPGSIEEEEYEVVLEALAGAESNEAAEIGISEPEPAYAAGLATFVDDEVLTPPPGEPEAAEFTQAEVVEHEAIPLGAPGDYQDKLLDDVGELEDTPLPPISDELPEDEESYEVEPAGELGEDTEEEKKSDDPPLPLNY